MPTLKVNDLQMYYTETGDGPPLVALHAATAEGLLMSWLAASLEDDGFNVITPDMRGHGQTPNPAGDLHLHRLVEDLIEFLYQLGRTPVHGVGYSMGGGVLLYAARRQPDLFRSLALLGTNYHAPTQERIRQAVGLPLDQWTEDMRAVFDPETGVVVGWDAPVETFSRVPVPTLIMCADRDEFNDVEDSLALYRAMPGAELLVVPATNHLGLVRHPHVHAALQSFYIRVRR